MTMGHEKSDDPVVPEGRRKAAPTAADGQGGKGITVSEVMVQLELFRATADSPEGDVEERGAGEPADRPRSLPKARTTQSPTPSTMTMEAVAAATNLRRDDIVLPTTWIPG